MFDPFGVAFWQAMTYTIAVGLNIRWRHLYSKQQSDILPLGKPLLLDRWLHGIYVTRRVNLSACHFLGLDRMQQDKRIKRVEGFAASLLPE